MVNDVNAQRANNWHVVVRHSFADVSGLLLDWCAKAHQAIIVEHSPDEDENRLHCHIGLFDLSGNLEAFKKNNPLRDLFKEYYPGLYKPKANASWMWHLLKQPDKLIELNGLLRYVLKGGKKSEARVMFAKNITPAQIEEAELAWVVYPSKIEAKAKQCRFNEINDAIYERLNQVCQNDLTNLIERGYSKLYITEIVHDVLNDQTVSVHAKDRHGWYTKVILDLFPNAKKAYFTNFLRQFNSILDSPE